MKEKNLLEEDNYLKKNNMYTPLTPNSKYNKYQYHYNIRKNN
jgi:hypothetical protein